jgi:hypothetical protein
LQDARLVHEEEVVHEEAVERDAVVEEDVSVERHHGCCCECTFSVITSFQML